MHKISEDKNWDKSKPELVRDYIPLAILILMVVIGLVLVLILF